MKLTHAEVVLDFLGNPVQWGSKPMTMRDIATMALTAPEPPGAQRRGAGGKARCFALAQKLNAVPARWR